MDPLPSGSVSMGNEMIDLAGDPIGVLEFVKKAASLNLPDLMQGIDEAVNESKTPVVRTSSNGHQPLS